MQIFNGEMVGKDHVFIDAMQPMRALALRRVPERAEPQFCRDRMTGPEGNKLAGGQLPVTRQRLSQLLGREISRDVMARLKRLELIGAGPRVAQPGAPLTYVTTTKFLSVFGLNSLRDLPDMDGLVEAGLPDRGFDDGLAPDPLDAVLGRVDAIDQAADEPDALSAD